MVMKPEPIDRCLCNLFGIDSPQVRPKGSRIILMSPQGKPMVQAKAKELAGEYRHLILICGHYEGIDERILELWVDEEISIGDYVLTGGELPAMVVIDACARMVPGVLGHEDSAINDSFMAGVLDHPHYTRPPSFRDLDVPEVLISGHHDRIRRWRRSKSLAKTREVRPELLRTIDLGPEDINLLREADGLPPIPKDRKRKNGDLPN